MVQGGSILSKSYIIVDSQTESKDKAKLEFC